MTDAPWIPAVTGLPIDLTEPRADQVDFRAMAHALANLNRYAGHGEVQVSVALHKLIGLDICPEEFKPWWLLHDGHEWAVGEITTPAAKALAHFAQAVTGMAAASTLVERALAEFKRAHDVAIHHAAGLPMPNHQIREAIRAVDLRCLATEHLHFHRPSTRKWAHELLGVEPARNLRRWAPPDKIAEQLLARFTLHLPALRAVAA